MFPFFNYCTYLMKLLSLVCLVMYIHICYRSLILYFGNNLKFTPFECFSYQRAEDTGPFTVRNRQLKIFRTWRLQDVRCIFHVINSCFMTEERARLLDYVLHCELLDMFCVSQSQYAISPSPSTLFQSIA